MPNSVQNAENLSLGLGGKKNFVLGNSLNRRLLIDVHVAYNNNLGGEYVLSLIHIYQAAIWDTMRSIVVKLICLLK